MNELYMFFQHRPNELADRPHVCPQVCAYLGPWMGFDLRELEFSVVWVHLSDLFPRWGSQHLNIDGAGV